MRSSRAERDQRILRLRQNYIQKFAIMDQASPSSSNAQPTESAIPKARISKLAGITAKNAPASSSPAQVQRRDSKTAPTSESTSLPTPPASTSTSTSTSTTDEPKKSPSYEVFSKREIFETILLELRIQQVLVVALRVCREWKEMIDSSPRLQEALYFKPLPNPVEPRGEHFYEKGTQGGNAIIVTENPLLRRARRIVEDYHRFSHMKGRTGESTNQYSRRKARQKALIRPQASWRRMLAFQPPVLNIDVEHDTLINIDAIENRRGITMLNMAGENFRYWEIGCYPIENLYRNMQCFKLGRNISRMAYDPTDELNHGFGWQASFEIPPHRQKISKF
ncbi:hypothetical protein AC578_10896 [Pseudocercospora eumusae]|uniref:F-box domain-containing protein n=1 Tax=Pseudocercospora eumusae TaxID=321146 RepID=A0A139HFG5_9PEZI|nr:hypothetical protein AC578_10896 [Pseudocercospora eumusae]